MLQYLFCQKYSLRNCLRCRVIVSVCLTAILCCTTLIKSEAADWTINSSISQRFEVDDNLRLQSDDEGTSYGSISSATTEIVRDSPGQRLKLYGNVDLKGYTGDGSVEDDSSFTPRVGFDLGRQRVDKSLRVFGSVILRNATDEEFIRDVGTIDSNEQLELTIGTELNHIINSTNQLSFYLSATSTEYIDDDPLLDSSSKYNARVAWKRKLSETSGFALSIGFEESIPEFNSSDDQSTITVFGSYTEQVSEQLAWNFGVGASAVYVDSPGSSIQDDSEMTVPFNFGINYQLARTKLDLSVEHKFSSDSRNGLSQEKSSIDIAISHLINAESKFGFIAAYERTGELFSSADRDYFSVNPHYTRELAKGWTSNLGYLFRYDDNDVIGDETAYSNKFYISFSKAFDERRITSD